MNTTVGIVKDVKLLPAKFNFFTRFSRMHGLDLLGLFERVDDKISFAIRIFITAVVESSGVPLNVDGVRFFNRGTYPDFFFEMEQMTELVRPKFMMAGVFFAKRRYF